MKTILITIGIVLAASNFAKAETSLDVAFKFEIPRYVNVHEFRDRHENKKRDPNTRNVNKTQNGKVIVSSNFDWKIVVEAEDGNGTPKAKARYFFKSGDANVEVDEVAKELVDGSDNDDDYALVTYTFMSE